MSVYIYECIDVYRQRDLQSGFDSGSYGGGEVPGPTVGKLTPRRARAVGSSPVWVQRRRPMS